jgi:hypothetical protein
LALFYPYSLLLRRHLDQPLFNHYLLAYLFGDVGVLFRIQLCILSALSEADDYVKFEDNEIWMIAPIRRADLL